MPAPKTATGTGAAPPGVKRTWLYRAGPADIGALVDLEVAERRALTAHPLQSIQPPQAVASTTRPKAMRYQANTTKLWLAM